MSIKSDRWIRRMALEQGMIEPFEPHQIKVVHGRPVVSYGTSSYGYDIRCSNEFKLFTNINTTIAPAGLIASAAARSAPIFRRSSVELPSLVRHVRRNFLAKTAKNA